MNWDSWLLRLLVSSAMFVAVMVMFRAVAYCGKHPNTYRRTGAWLLAVSCGGFAISNLKWLVEGMDFACFSYHISTVVMTLGMLIAGLLLMVPNPAPVVDAEDYQIVMEHFKTATCEFALQVRSDKVKAREEKM